MQRLATKPKQQENRSGTATVEAAVTLPVLLLLVFGAIEASQAIHTRQIVSIAAYDAARIATKSAGTEANARVRAAEVLTQMGVNTYTVSFSTPVTETTARGTIISVTVSAPMPGHLSNFLASFREREFSKTVHMMRL